MRIANRFSSRPTAAELRRLGDIASTINRETDGLVTMFPPDPAEMNPADACRVEFMFRHGLRPCRYNRDPVRHLARELRRLARQYLQAAERLEGVTDD